MFWWHLLNVAVFDGILVAPKRIEIRTFRYCLGWCKGLKRKGKTILGISDDCFDRKEFLTVLVHEMVHAYEHQEIGKMSHGKTFYEWKSRIKRNTGLSLNEYID